MEDISVTLVASRVRDGVRRWERQGSASTDEDGTFRIASLPPGTYYISIGPGDQNMLSGYFELPAISWLCGVFLSRSSRAQCSNCRRGRRRSAGGSGSCHQAGSHVSSCPGMASGFGSRNRGQPASQTAAGELVAFAMRFDDSMQLPVPEVPAGSGHQSPSKMLHCRINRNRFYLDTCAPD